MSYSNKLWEEFHIALRELHDPTASVYNSIGRFLSVLDLLKTSGVLDSQKIQNEKILERIKITERIGFPDEYINPLPNYEKPINHYDQ